MVKFVFPALRKRCEARSVTWSEVDLRWGVTDEQRDLGQVLPICLDVIERCRPYFICVLGERYGWIPDELPANLVERERWLAPLRGRSVTELEILHGVLNNFEMADHAYFYFRDPAYAESLPAERHADFREPTLDGRRKLADLKARIRARKLPVRENFRDPTALGNLVLADFTALIDRLFPESAIPDPLQVEGALNTPRDIARPKWRAARRFAKARSAKHRNRNNFACSMRVKTRDFCFASDDKPGLVLRKGAMKRCIALPATARAP